MPISFVADIPVVSPNAVKMAEALLLVIMCYDNVIKLHSWVFIFKFTRHQIMPTLFSLFSNFMHHIFALSQSESSIN